MFRIPALTLALALPLAAQETKPTPTEELRVSIRQWVETMQKIQIEENDWERDQEVLQNYREGLEKEILDLKEQIASANTRKEGTDKDSIAQTQQRDRYAAAKDTLSTAVRSLEESLSEKLPLFPAPLLTEPKVAQGVEDLKRDLSLPVEKRGENVSKRLLNVINLLSEAEKFQQTVHVRPELRKDSQGREFNMKVIYFGLAAAFAVNEDGTFALVGTPSKSGWTFEEHKDLAPDIQHLISSTTGDKDAAFIQLPISKP